MKKLMLLGAALVVLAPAAAMAYGMAGCGLGSLAFTENGQWQQVLAATTNGTFGTQTFGISTGTSNCTKSGALRESKEREVFVSMNFDTLSKEMSRGSGENLYVLSHLYGCPTTESKTFMKATQANYDRTISKAQSPEQMMSAVSETVNSNPTLARTCSKL